MRGSGGSRLEWDAVPQAVREAVGAGLGAPVETAVNESGGFSPGVAARCTLADGRRVFVKALSTDQNPQAPRIHRREAEVAAQLPADLPAPRLLHVHDDGRWVVLVFEQIPGRQPDEPWRLDELDRVMEALTRFSAAATPSPAQVQTVVDRHAAVFSGWRRIAGGDGDPSSWFPEIGSAVDALAAREATWADAARGDTLLHADLRADNILLTDDGVVFVDWPWACEGAAFVDAAFMVPSIGLGGGPDPATVIARYDILRAVDTDRLVAVMAAITGFFVRASLDDPPPGLPALREFQRAQARVALPWLLAQL